MMETSDGSWARTTQTRDEDRRARRAERRRRAREQQLGTSVPSPCVSVCRLEDGTDLCTACRRHVDEIRDWPIMTAEEKRATLARIEERRAADAEAAAGRSGGGNGGTDE